MTTTDGLALEVENLRKVFRVTGGGRAHDEIVAVDDVSFTVARGGSRLTAAARIAASTVAAIVSCSRTVR